MFWRHIAMKKFIAVVLIIIGIAVAFGAIIQSSVEKR
jgi:hypothetical protein